MLHRWHIYTPPPPLLPWAGWMFPSDPPHSLFLTTAFFLSRLLVLFPPACPHLAFLWPPICQNPWHPTPSPIHPVTALGSINSLLAGLSVRSVFNPRLWFSCPSKICSKHPNQACASPEDISGPPRELLLKVLSCFFCLLPSKLAFCMLESAASASCPSIQLLSGSSYWIMWLIKGKMNVIYCCFSPHTSSLPFSFLFL